MINESLNNNIHRCVGCFDTKTNWGHFKAEYYKTEARENNMIQIISWPILDDYFDDYDYDYDDDDYDYDDDDYDYDDDDDDDNDDDIALIDYHAQIRNNVETHPKKKQAECKDRYCDACFKGMILSQNVYPIRCMNCQKTIPANICFQVLDKADHDKLRQLRSFTQRVNNKDLMPCYGQGCFGNVDKTKKNKKQRVKCDNCDSENCTVCFDVHNEGQTCQDWRKENALILANRIQVKKANRRKVKRRQGMYCPKCNSFIVFNGGCDWIKCVFCYNELCCRTQQNRWGPKGRGDTSGGCQCGVNGVKCHKLCKICH